MNYEQYKVITEALESLKKIAEHNIDKHGSLRSISIAHEQQADAGLKAAREAFAAPHSIVLSKGRIHATR